MAKSSLGLLAIIFYIGQCSSLNIDLSWLSNPNFPGNSGWMQSLGFNRPNQPSYTSTPNPAPWSPSPPQNYLPQYSPWNRPTNNYWGGQPTQPNNQMNAWSPGYQGQNYYFAPQVGPTNLASGQQPSPAYQPPSNPFYPNYQVPENPTAHSNPATASPGSQHAINPASPVSSGTPPKKFSKEWYRLYRNRRMKSYPKNYPNPPSCEPTANPGFPYRDPKTMSFFKTETAPKITYTAFLCSDPRYSEKFYQLKTKLESPVGNGNLNLSGNGNFSFNNLHIINNVASVTESVYYKKDGTKIEYKPYIQYTFTYGDPQDGVKRVHDYPAGVDPNDESFRSEYYRYDV